MIKEDIFEEYKFISKSIMRVEINQEKLIIVWSNNKKETFYLRDLKKISIITTDEGPFKPEVFWLLMFEFPIMVPCDDLIPGSLEIADFLLKLPNFNYKKFIQAMSSTRNNAFELWEVDNQKLK